MTEALWIIAAPAIAGALVGLLLSLRERPTQDLSWRREPTFGRRK